MKSFKLTKAIRESIANELLKDVAAEAKAATLAWQLHEDAIARSVLVEWFKDAKSHALFQSCPTHWFPPTSYVHVFFGNSYSTEYLYFRDANGKSEQVRAPHGFSQRAILLEDKDPRVVEYRRLEEVKDAATKRLGDLTRTVKSSLNDYTTSSTLMDAWPEIASIVVKHTPFRVAKTKALSIPRQELNTKLRLPREEEAYA